MTTITAAIRADAATSDAEGRAQAAEMVTAAVIERLAETVTRLNASEDRALRLEVERDAFESDLIAKREALTEVRTGHDSARAAITADLNATREKLATAEAFRDSLQAEVDGLRAERDAQQADLVGLHCAAAERDTMRELLKAARGALVDVANVTGVNAIDVSSRMVGAQCAAAIVRLRAEHDAAIKCADVADLERDALRAEVDKLRARPVLTEAAVRLAITSKRTCEEGPRIGTPATIYAQLTEGGPVTIRSQTLTTDVLHAAMGAAIAEAEAKGWRKAGWSISAADILRHLGAVTLPDQDRLTKLEAHLRDMHKGADDGEAQEAWLYCAELVSAEIRALGAPAMTPSKPADVFAGVALSEIGAVAIRAGNRHANGLKSGQEAVARAVLDALRVKLVVPVDPIVVAKDYHDHPSSAAPRWMCDDMDGMRVDAARAMRDTLTAKGIPVTPEAGK